MVAGRYPDPGGGSPRRGVTPWRSCRRQPVRSGCCAASSGSIQDAGAWGRRQSDRIAFEWRTATRSRSTRQGDNLHDLAPGALDAQPTSPSGLGRSRAAAGQRHGNRGQRHTCLRCAHLYCWPWRPACKRQWGLFTLPSRRSTYDDIEPSLVGDRPGNRIYPPARAPLGRYTASTWRTAIRHATDSVPFGSSRSPLGHRLRSAPPLLAFQ